MRMSSSSSTNATDPVVLAALEKVQVPLNMQVALQRSRREYVLYLAVTVVMVLLFLVLLVLLLV